MQDFSSLTSLNTGLWVSRKTFFSSNLGQWNFCICSLWLTKHARTKVCVALTPYLFPPSQVPYLCRNVALTTQIWRMMEEELRTSSVTSPGNGQDTSTAVQTSCTNFGSCPLARDSVAWLKLWPSVFRKLHAYLPITGTSSAGFVRIDWCNSASLKVFHPRKSTAASWWADSPILYYSQGSTLVHPGVHTLHAIEWVQTSQKSLLAWPSCLF